MLVSKFSSKGSLEIGLLTTENYAIGYFWALLAPKSRAGPRNLLMFIAAQLPWCIWYRRTWWNSQKYHLHPYNPFPDPTFSLFQRRAWIPPSIHHSDTCFFHARPPLLKIWSMCSRLFLWVVSRYWSFFPRFSISDFSSVVSVDNLLSTSAMGLNTNLPIEY